MAQDVYAARLEGAHSLEDQLEMVRLWRDLTVFLNDWQGHIKMQRLMTEALGEVGVELLGEIENDNWKRFAFPLS